MKTIILDLGSHCAKAYLKDKQISELGNISWRLLEAETSSEDIEKTLQILLAPFRTADLEVKAIGTEAMRRSPALSKKISDACERLSISYRTLSQEEEANLLFRAFPEVKVFDLVNAGGGSIQLISKRHGKISLLPFGISDLNRLYNLNGKPEERCIEECIDWIVTQLPDKLSEFIYTGGEERYLRHMGVPLTSSHCSFWDFEKMAKRMAKLPLVCLEGLTPHDPGWMRGAIASNCIVLACLRKSQSDRFIPSDRNIAHGMLAEVAVQ